jgi:hypothetical protein
MFPDKAKMVRNANALLLVLAIAPVAYMVTAGKIAPVKPTMSIEILNKIDIRVGVLQTFLTLVRSRIWDSRRGRSLAEVRAPGLANCLYSAESRILVNQ